jgi:hypothetical protein
MRPLGWLALLGWHLGIDWLKDILSLQTVTVLESIIGWASQTLSVEQIITLAERVDWIANVVL